MKKIKIASSVVSLLVLCVCMVGCDVKTWDPTQVGRFKPVPTVNVILDSLGVVEETPAAWESGEEPKPTDVVAYDTDYVFGPGDYVNISIFELFQEGALYTNQFVVTETGKLSIPDVGVVNAGGLTESQLEEEIKQEKFRNEYHKLAVNIVFTHNWLMGLQSEMFNGFEITANQFNILRILRGQYPNPATINLLKERMMDKMCDASRLVERLRLKGYVKRELSPDDRRRVDVIITGEGLNLLSGIDKLNAKYDAFFENLTGDEAILLNDLLDKMRK